MNESSELVLGKKVDYKTNYDPTLLQSVSRDLNRNQLSDCSRQMFGFDCWNMYELSWLNAKGKPQVAIGDLYIPCKSPDLVESKSFKLYLNSFNQTSFANWQDVVAIITKDLSECTGSNVDLFIHQLDNAPQNNIQIFDGTNLDDQDISCEQRDFDNSLLDGAVESSDNIISECLYSHLLKSNCLITHQPDWGSVLIKYKGAAISHEKLLQYLISFRLHNEFHEHCVERIFYDINSFCKPKELSVYARYTRRGGLDINPYRSTESIDLENFRKLNSRLVRQ